MKRILENMKNLWPVYVGSLAVILVVNALALQYNIFRNFNIFDMATDLGAAWRVYTGQKPFQDFIYHTGPLHIYTSAFFFHLFGFAKNTQLLHVVIISTMVILLTFDIFRRHLPWYLVIFVVWLTSFSYYIPTSYPWYDFTAHFWGIIALWAVIAHMPLENHPRKVLISSLTGVLVGVVIMAKTNIGIYYGAAFLVYWIAIAKKPIEVLSYILAVIVTFVVLLYLLAEPYHYFRDAIWAYAFRQWFRFTRNTGGLIPKSYVPLMLVVLLCAGRNWKVLKEKLVLFLGTMVLGFLAVKSSSLGTANTPLRGIQVGLALMLLWENGKILSSPLSKRINQTAIVFVVLLGTLFGLKSFYHGWARDKWMFSDAKLGDYPLKTPPFEGWMFERKDGEAIDAMVAYMRENVPKEETLLIAGNVQIVDILLGRESYRGLPYIYSDLVMLPEQTHEVVQKIMANPPQWIVYELDREGKVVNEIAYVPDFFLAKYGRVKTWGRYALYKAK